MESIYNFTNYREFLKCYYEHEKLSRKNFSYQFWADNCGFKSKSYLYKVIRGEKALTVEGADKIGSFMKLNKTELHYFSTIVLFTNSKSLSERTLYFERLQKLSKNSESATIRENQISYFTHWYNVVVRELISISDWKADYSQLAKMVVPTITAREAERSVKLLLKIGMVKCDAEGKYSRVNRAVSTGSDITSLAVNTFQRQNLTLAAEAIDRFPREERDISTLTVSVSAQGAAQLQNEIAAFRKKLISIVDSDSDVDRVYQLNFQAFPLSTPLPGDM